MMSDGFWQSLHLDILWPILVPQVVMLVKMWWDGKQARAAQAANEAARTHLSAKIDENTLATVAVKDAAERSQSEVSQSFVAGMRAGYEKGIPVGRQQASGPMPLEPLADK